MASTNIIINSQRCGLRSAPSLPLPLPLTHLQAKVAKMHAPLTEEEQRALEERIAKDRWDRMSEMQRVTELEKQAQEVGVGVGW